MLPNNTYMSKVQSDREGVREGTTFDDLSRHEQEALIEYARRTAVAEKKFDKENFASFFKAEHARLSAAQDKSLKAMAAKYVEAAE